MLSAFVCRVKEFASLLPSHVYRPKTTHSLLNKLPSRGCPSDTPFIPMFTSFHAMIPSDAEIASQALNEEGSYRFPSFSASDAVTLGLSLRKRFRASSRHAKGKGLVISIQTIAGHTLFACTVGDLGHPAGVGDVSLNSWTTVEGMVGVVKQTGHSSYYVEKSMSAMGKSAKQMGIQGDVMVHGGGECFLYFPER